MATLGTYYFDTASFNNATTLYDDAALSTVASNGFYSDDSIVRQQVSGVLFAAQSCAVPTPVPTPTAPIPTPVPAPVVVPVPVPVPAPTAPAPAPTAPVPTAPVPAPVPTAPVPTAPVPIAPPVPAPTAPVPVPVAPAPAPVPACEIIFLKYSNVGGNNACNEGSTMYYADNGTFCSASTIYTDSGCTTLAPIGYYSDGVNYRYWNQASLLACQACTAPTPAPSAPVPAPVAITYYRFVNCSTSQFVWQTFGSAPTNNGRYFNGIQYFRHDGTSTTLPGSPIVSNLTFVGQFGCP